MYINFSLPVESETQYWIYNDIKFKIIKYDQKLHLKQRSFYNKIKYVNFIPKAQQILKYITQNKNKTHLVFYKYSQIF